MSTRKESDSGVVAALHPSRRQFLKGMGLAAGAVAIAPDLASAQGAPPDEGFVELGRDAQEIKLRINGEARTVKVEPRATLLDVLREKADLTGAKEICDRGACGGCSVLVNGQTAASCMMLAIDAQDLEITTVEGIARDPKFAPLIDAYCECDAAQCGYCIPGFVVKSAELLTLNPSPTREQIQDGLSGNICRCGTYTMIFDAVEKCAKKGGLA